MQFGMNVLKSVGFDAICEITDKGFKPQDIVLGLCTGTLHLTQTRPDGQFGMSIQTDSGVEVAFIVESREDGSGEAYSCFTRKDVSMYNGPERLMQV